MLKKIAIWTLAVIISLGSMVYQRLTGPTYPKKVTIETADSSYQVTLPRTYDCQGDCPVKLALPGDISGNILFRKYPGDHPWDTLQLQRMSDTLQLQRAVDTLVAWLPQQPPAGKLEYHLELKQDETTLKTNLQENIVIRFKGCVPDWALIPHVILMIFAMLWSNATGLLAAFNIESYRRNALVAIILFVTGGLILGPIVQKYAFGAFWTGWPLGEDLTDNKVLFSVIIWVVAYLLNRKKDRRWLIFVAALVLFAIYMIPHSMHGSELDYSSGEIISAGMAALLLMRLKTTPATTRKKSEKREEYRQELREE